MNKYFYVTTPIYYVNDVPHIGHAYTSIAADSFARFKKLDGYLVKFLTGTDEHGQKVEQSAKNQNIKPQEFVDKMSIHFENLSGSFLLTNDDFIRTTQERHKKAAKAIFKKIFDNGYIYEDTYNGWYSVSDEAFYQEEEIIDGFAPTGSPVQWVEQPCMFFKLSQFQELLLDFYKNNPNFIAPLSRFNEVESFVKGGLKDLAISRSNFKWGINIPNSKHVMYVWIDALTNYITALGYPETSERFKNYCSNSLHIVGKDIIRFHAVYWPAFLMAAEIELPKRIFAHGWWTNDGAKISKSLNNAIDPFALCDEFGVDACRYFLLREVPFGKDGNFSKEALKNRINTDLANNYGNLVQRVASFIIKYCNGEIIAPSLEDLDDDDLSLLKNAFSTLDCIRELIDVQALHKVCEKIWEYISNINKYIDVQEPWQLRKSHKDKMEVKLYTASLAIIMASILTISIIPKSSNRALDIFSFNSAYRKFSSIDNFKQSLKDNLTNCELWQDLKISNLEILFNKV